MKSSINYVKTFVKKDGYNFDNTIKKTVDLKNLNLNEIKPTITNYAKKTKSFINNIGTKYNDQLYSLNGVSKKIMEAVSKYPKGTFKRVNKTILVDGKKHTIVFEGVKVDFDITAEGLVVQKTKALLAKPTAQAKTSNLMSGVCKVK